MSAMHAQATGFTFDVDGSLGTKSYSSGLDLSSSSGTVLPFLTTSFPQQFAPMSFMSQFSQLPYSGPQAFVSQYGSGTYNNFKGNNFKSKGKGNKFFSGNQS